MLPRKPLKEYTNQEIYKILEDNENQSQIDLSYICSEVLRRWMYVDIAAENEAKLNQ